MNGVIIDRGRGPEIAGSRITVYDVLAETQSGATPEQLAQEWGLRLEQVHAALRYIEEHKEEVLADYREIKARHARGNPPEVQAILDAIGLKEADRIKPRILSSQVIRKIDDHQAQLINRMRHGQMIIPGHTLYVLEVEPAAYAALAANEAEKAANINILEVRAFGSFGRIYLGGEEADIDVGYRAAVAAVEAIGGREATRG